MGEIRQRKMPVIGMTGIVQISAVGPHAKDAMCAKKTECNMLSAFPAQMAGKEVVDGHTLPANFVFVASFT